jgi:acyl-coenzyme A thioesterase PaaI-like protein
LTLLPAGVEVLTVELKSNLLAPARSGTIRARGEVLRTGRTLSVCRGEAHEIAGDATTHVATMPATMIARAEQHCAAASA